MKTRLLPFLVACALALSSFAVAGEPPDLGVVHDFASKTTAKVASTKIGEITRPLGLPFNLDGNTFAGVGGGNGRLVAGVSATYRWAWAQNAVLSIGPAVTLSTPKRPSFGVYLGFRVYFTT